MHPYTTGDNRLLHILFSLRSLCALWPIESLYLSFCGSGTTNESQLSDSKTLNIRFSRPILKTILCLFLSKERSQKPQKSFDKCEGFINNGGVKAQKTYLLVNNLSFLRYYD